MRFQAHQTAVIDEKCQIGDNTKIWHFTHICSGAIIGEDCTVGQNVYVAGNAVIGNSVKIQNNVSIYDNVILEDDVFCGPSCVFTNVTNPRSQFSRKDEYKITTIKKGATLGANCTIVCGHTIYQYAFIAAGAVVTKDVLPFALMAGVPAKQIGWMSKSGGRLDLPLSLDGTQIAKCPDTGGEYVLTGNRLIVKSG